MGLHWANVNLSVFSCPYPGHDMGFERMSNQRNRYVSVFRIHGVPLLPPILTDEDRRKCQIYKQQAIDVEKRLQEKRLMKKKQLEAVPEESPQCEAKSSSSGAMEVLEFIREALGDSNDLEEVKFLISQVGEELKKRRSISSRDSTFNDVDSISLNQNTDPCNLEVVANYFDKQSVTDSVSHDSFHSESKKFDVEQLVCESSILEQAVVEKPQVVVSESVEPVMSEFVRNTNQLPGNEEYESLVSESSKLNVSDSHYEKVSPNRSCESLAVTPPKLIRSNSYTLDSPSPSVLMYLRSLALENASEKVEVSSKVIKNLNNYWKEEDSKITSPLKAVFELENGVEKLESDNSDNEQNSYSTLVNNNVGLLKNPDESNEIDEEKVKAAVIIQAAARGFLIRRLMKTQKIKDLKVIIKEAVLCAWSLYGEQAVSPADIQLHERIIQQVTAACYELHCIFFNWSTADKMALIRSDREKLKYPKPKFRISRDRKVSESNSVSSSIRSKSASSISGMSRSSTPRELQRPTTLPSALRKNIRHQVWSR